MSPSLAVRTVDASTALALVPTLSEILIACVDAGASVSFMHPLSRDAADAFWTRVAEGVGRGERVLLVAFEGETTVGTVQVIVDLPENQPHRADVAKLLVHPAYRGKGLGAALMEAAEPAARALGRTLLCLDTASPAADRLYRRAGWTCAGRIPDYALNPDGSLTHTDIFWKRIAP